MAGRNGRKSGLSVLWIPKKKHGHKKEKYYRPQADKLLHGGRSTSGSGMFSPGSPYSRRKHQPEPEWPIASGSAAATSGAAVAPPTATTAATAVTAATTSAALETAVVVEQQRANGTAPPHTASEPPAAESTLALLGDAMSDKSDKESSNLRNQEEAIEMADDQTNQAVLGSLADCDVFMNNSNNNKSNGHLDCADSAIVRKKKKKRKNKKKNNSDKEDECGIRCLSYALQCCECVIS